MAERTALQHLTGFAILMAVAVALRLDTFGDPNLHGDEVFYQTVGVAMHHGAKSDTIGFPRCLLTRMR